MSSARGHNCAHVPVVKLHSVRIDSQARVSVIGQQVEAQRLAGQWILVLLARLPCGTVAFDEGLLTKFTFHVLYCLIHPPDHLCAIRMGELRESALRGQKVKAGSRAIFVEQPVHVLMHLPYLIAGVSDLLDQWPCVLLLNCDSHICANHNAPLVAVGHYLPHSALPHRAPSKVTPFRCVQQNGLDSVLSVCHHPFQEQLIFGQHRLPRLATAGVVCYIEAIEELSQLQWMLRVVMHPTNRPERLLLDVRGGVPEAGVVEPIRKQRLERMQKGKPQSLQELIGSKMGSQVLTNEKQKKKKNKNTHV